jgi:hypothetical protein
MALYRAVSVESRQTGQSVRWYLIGWQTLLDCSTLAVCQTQDMAEAMRDALMNRIPQEHLWHADR